MSKRRNKGLSYEWLAMEGILYTQDCLIGKFNLLTSTQGEKKNITRAWTRLGAIESILISFFSK